MFSINEEKLNKSVIQSNILLITNCAVSAYCILQECQYIENAIANENQTDAILMLGVCCLIFLFSAIFAIDLLRFISEPVLEYYRLTKRKRGKYIRVREDETEEHIESALAEKDTAGKSRYDKLTAIIIYTVGTKAENDLNSLGKYLECLWGIHILFSAVIAERVTPVIVCLCAIILINYIEMKHAVRFSAAVCSAKLSQSAEKRIWRKTK